MDELGLSEPVSSVSKSKNVVVGEAECEGGDVMPLDVDTNDLYLRMKELQRELEFIEIQVKNFDLFSRSFSFFTLFLL
jgi:hypothetical protein